MTNPPREIRAQVQAAGDRWDAARCSIVRRGVSLIDAARWFNEPSPEPFPSDEELRSSLAARLENHPRIDLLISHKGNIGDSIMCSTVAHELRRRGVKNIWLETKWRKDFVGQPLFDGVLDECYESEWLAEELGAKIIFPYYSTVVPGEDRETVPPHHILGEMCRQAGVVGEVSLRPYFDAGTRLPFDLPRDFIALSAMGSRHLQMKNWFLPRFQTLARNLAKDHAVVQLGTLHEPPLPGVIDLRGRTTVAQAAAVLKRAECFIGQLDGLMHLARAVDCPSVIIFGGRESVRQSGYSENTNLIGRVPCSPCWKFEFCPNEMACMEPIQPRDVADAAERVIRRGKNGSLTCEKHVIHA